MTSPGFIFSFRPRFVNAVRAGLGLRELEPMDRFPPAAGLVKRQTIRADRKDGKRPEVGQEIHLFTGMRTKQCLRIAPRQTAFVTSVRDIEIVLGDRPYIKLTPGLKLVSPVQLYVFAKDDGFADWHDMYDFWCDAHPKVEHFHGFITFWNEPPAPARPSARDLDREYPTTTKRRERS